MEINNALYSKRIISTRDESKKVKVNSYSKTITTTKNGRTKLEIRTLDYPQHKSTVSWLATITSYSRRTMLSTATFKDELLL